jgi:hypothetical protein
MLILFYVGFDKFQPKKKETSLKYNVVVVGWKYNGNGYYILFIWNHGFKIGKEKHNIRVPFHFITTF